MALTEINSKGIKDADIATADLADDAITSAKIADDAVVAAAIADDAVTSAAIADDAVGLAQLSATGTADNTKFLRGDNSWQVVSIPKLDTPVVTGDFEVADVDIVSHSITD